MTRLSRRVFLGTGAALALGRARSARAETAPPPPPASLSVLDLTVDGDRDLARRFTLFVPKNLPKDRRVPLLVLLHGLGETGDPRLGAYAWVERYGLGSAYDRLVSPPIAATSKRPDFPPARLAAINGELAAEPFQGLVIACPVTPNVSKVPNPAGALDRYAAWLADVVIPRARKEAPVFQDAQRTRLDGCSLGGFVGLEVFVRKPGLFGAFGTVQAAISVDRAPRYADRLAAVLKASPKPVHLETSQGDAFREGNVALSAELKKRGVANDLTVLPGPHDQPWLREVGTLEMLLWHDRVPR